MGSQKLSPKRPSFSERRSSVLSRKKRWSVVKEQLPKIVEYGRKTMPKHKPEVIQANTNISDIPTEDEMQQKDAKSADWVNLPTDDISTMHEAIPFLPVPVALLCLFLNIFIPGFGTIISGAFGICMGQPRMNMKEGRRLFAFFVNLFVGVSQFFTITFFLVGFFWSVAWGGLIIIHSIQYREAILQKRKEARATRALESITNGGLMYRRNVKTLVTSSQKEKKETKEPRRWNNLRFIKMMMLKLVSLFLLVALAYSDDGISCDFCKLGLAQMTANIQSNPELMAQMGDSISQGCDQVPNKDERQACRLTLDDNFPLFLQNFLQQPDTSATDFCTAMGYCQ